MGAAAVPRLRETPETARQRERAASAALRHRVDVAAHRFTTEIADLLTVLSEQEEEVAAVETVLKTPHRRRGDVR